MENGAFAPKEQMLHFHNIFQYMIFRRRQKVLLWSKGLTYANHLMGHSGSVGRALDCGSMVS